MTDEPIDDLIASCLDRIEREGQGAVDAFCREHPQHENRIRSRIESLRALGLVAPEPAASSSDGGAVAKRLGDFTLLARIGSGGMGVVYRARQESLQREVALKLVHPEHLLFPGARERFRREADAASRLRHPSIVTVHAFGEEAGVPYLAMELVDGTSLAEVLEALRDRDPARLTGPDLWRALGPDREPRRGDVVPPPFAQDWSHACARIAEQVAEALAHAHAHGVLHRDVKPGNVMLDRDGRVRLLDFGLAHAEGATALTRTRSELGSLPYMAPEQARGDAAAIDIRTDVYGLGVTLYEMLALRPPFAATTSAALRERIGQGSAPPVSRLNAAVPYDLQVVVATAMEREPSRRYPLAAALAADLRAILESRRIAARPLPLALRTRRWAQRHPALATGVGLGLMALAVLSTGLWLQQRAASERIAGERDAARASLDDALTAVDRMLVHVGDQSLAFVPRMDKVRLRLLEEALALLRVLGERSGSEDVVVMRGARTRARIGTVLFYLGRSDDALVELRAARAALGILGERAAAPAVLEPEQAFAEFWIGRILHDRGETGLALEHVRRSTDLYRRALARAPSSTRLQDRFAESLRGAATLCWKTNDLEGGERLTREGIEFCTGLTGPGIDRVAPLVIASELRANRARARSAQGDVAGAMAELELALGLLERARGIDPDDLTVGEAEVYQRVSLALLHARRNDPQAAIAVATAAIEAAQRIARDYPRPHYQGELAHALITRGTCLRRNDLERAMADWEAAIEILEPQVQDHPDLLDLASYCGIAHGLLAEAQLAVRDDEAARPHLQRGGELHRLLIERRPDDANEQARYGLVNRRLALWHRGRAEHEAARAAAEQAVLGYRRALRLRPDVPTHRDDLRSTGLLHAQICAEAGGPEQAVTMLRELHADVGLARRDLAGLRELRRLPEFEALVRELPAERR
jgi:serine/threonine protein kinase